MKYKNEINSFYDDLEDEIYRLMDENPDLQRNEAVVIARKNLARGMSRNEAQIESFRKVYGKKDET